MTGPAPTWRTISPATPQATRPVTPQAARPADPRPSIIRALNTHGGREDDVAPLVALAVLVASARSTTAARRASGAARSGPGGA